MRIKDFAEGLGNIVNVFGDKSFENEMARVRGGDAISEGWNVAGSALAASVNAIEEIGQMASVIDVARYIAEKRGAMTAMKLQKLVYYSQAWSLVWDESPLFPERIEAWANGPVVPELYEVHRGTFQVGAGHFQAGDSAKLSPTQKASIDRVLAFYGDKTAQWLSDLTHVEAPWNDARGDLPKGDRCSNEITTSSMHEYYSGI